MPTNIIQKKEKEIKKAKEALQYTAKGADLEALNFYKNRREELQAARKTVSKGKLEELWRGADDAYVPHTLKASGKKVFASDDELGWRSTQIVLGTDDWQEKSIATNPYVKIQTALGILIDRNPKAVMKGLKKEYEGASVLHSHLHLRNWDVADSKQQLKVAILNGSKYGIICGRTFPLKVQRKVKNLTHFDPKDPSKNEYEEVEQVYYNDVFREALNPWHCWFDDMAKPGHRFSMNDWTWFKDYDYDRVKEQFGHLEAFKYIKPRQKTKAESGEEQSTDQPPRENLVKLWFYENLTRDTFFVMSDDEVVLVNEPLPRDPRNKRLSCWVAPWTLRDFDTIYGIGTYESMRNNYKVYLKVRNMTVNQLVLSIYKSWFHEGTNMLEGTGEIKIKPGVGQQVSNAKNIVWNDIKGPGPEAWQGLEYFERKMDEDTGITPTLEGELSPKAMAFDIAQAREAGLKRLKTPLDNIVYALEQDAYISVGLYEETYSIPEIEEFVESDKVEDYRREVEEQGREVEFEEVEEGLMKANIYRQVPLNIDRDTEGNITESEEDVFFNLRPADLPWEGIIEIKGQSIVVESPLLERQETLDFANLMIPLFLQPFEVVGNACKQLAKAFKKEPKDWFPLQWIQSMEGGQQGQSPPQLFIPQGGQQPQQQSMAPRGRMPQAQTVVPSTEMQQGQRSLIGKFISKLSPFQ